MIGSNTSGVATSGGGQAALLSALTSVQVNFVWLANLGSSHGLFSVDNGVNWGVFPANAFIKYPVPQGLPNGVLIKPLTGGPDLTQCFGFTSL